MPNRFNTVAGCSLLVAMAVLVGCESSQQIDEREAAAVLATQQASAEKVFLNDVCPIGNEPVATQIGAVAYKGHNVGFCCPGCKEMWSSMPEDERDAFIDGVIEANQERADG